jgi:glycosyltransferase involved in cell wall biosynthesis
MMRGQPDWQREAGFLHHPQARPTLPPSTALERIPQKTVAFIGPSCASIAVTAGSLLHEIASLGHYAFCFAPELKDRAAWQALRRLRSEVHSLPAFRQGFSPIADQLGIIRLARAFKKIRPDVAVGFTPKGAALAGIAGRMTGVPHIVAMIGELGRGFEEAPESASFVGRQMQKTLLRLAFGLSHTAVFFNEENHKLLQLHHLLPDRLRQFPMNGSGVDLRHFPPAQLPPLDHGVLFLYAGPLDRRFGIAEFCKAARYLQNKPGRYKCLVAGPEAPGPHGFPLSALKRYRDVVHYLGPRTDPRPDMARTHVFVLPARSDAVPQALIEAVAMGRPIITSTSRGCRVVVREGENGMIVPPGDAAALAGAMSRLLMRPDLIPSMARASRRLAEHQFDSRRINALLLAALDL